MSAAALNAQQVTCVFKSPQITIHFGKGNVRDVNTSPLAHYSRVNTYCPVDGYFSYVPYTSDCFGGDWHTIEEDHTPGDEEGNMLLINASPLSGAFLTTTIVGLKGGTTYEFGVWMMNVCRVSDKCPFPLLPNITIQLQTPDGNILAQLNIGDVPRVPTPVWAQYRAMFTTPATAADLILTMVNNAPGGCGNDFAVDDITFRECVKVEPKPVPKIVEKKPAVVNKQPPPKKQRPEVAKQTTTAPKTTEIRKPTIDSVSNRSVLKPTREVFPPPPSVLTTRDNSLVKRIEMPAGEIHVELYDNGEIDGDTVSIYHNNILIKSRAGLSAKPISFNISINESNPYHELIMVANNLGSIPPNTSVMIITAGGVRHEVFISSSEQKNAKVVFELKKNN